MKNLTEKEWDIIKYSLSFLHNRDLSLFYDERTISTLENTMRKLDVDFVSQEEKDKKKIEKYVVDYQGDRREICINYKDKAFTAGIIEDKIKEAMKDNNVSQNALRILINENTFYSLRNVFITLGYTMTLSYLPVSIDKRIENGELKLVQRGMK